jgi:hypothetical protein
MHVDGDTKGATWLPPQTSTEQQKQLKQDAEFFLLWKNLAHYTLIHIVYDEGRFLL